MLHALCRAGVEEARPSGHENVTPRVALQRACKASAASSRTGSLPSSRAGSIHDESPSAAWIRRLGSHEEHNCSAEDSHSRITPTPSPHLDPDMALQSLPDRRVNVQHLSDFLTAKSEATNRLPRGLNASSPSQVSAERYRAPDACSPMC